MTNWLERLKGESQTRLLQLLRRSAQSITDLARHLGLTDNAVRTHVAALEREGLVELAGSQRDTGGKPARLYTLTREGEELFPKAYALVLGELVEEIARRDGRERAMEFLAAVGRRVGQAGDGENLEDRVTRAANALRTLGGDVELTREPDGWRIRGFGCPLSAVTTEHPEVCELARALIAEITGSPVSECCDRSSRPRCGFHIAEHAKG